MGGKNKNKKMWNRKRKLELNSENANKERKQYAKVISSNPKMESYYAALGLHALKRDGDTKLFVPCTSKEEKEEERMKFLTSLRTTLPASFRIGQNIEPEFRNQLLEDVERFVGTEIEIEIDQDGNAVSKPRGAAAAAIDVDVDSDIKDDSNADVKDDADAADSKNDSNAASASASEGTGTDTNANAVETAQTQPTTMKKLAPAKPIPYIPNAYQLSVDRRTIRRNPALQEFHEWLKLQSDAGFITRQETVSMIPPVVLSAEPHHAVLDMCAAPGSKTSQLLEIVSAIPPGKIEPQGFVVANDSDAKRAYMLVHQLRRLNSPAAFVTAKDAQFWPMLLRGENTTDEERAQEGMFDRVLCDVPCSGDGTARKNPGIWKHWTASSGHSLHPLQLSIALNGARLAKVGGYICYSTCSMNPIENEAVVAEILRSADGSLELVDKRPDMPGIIARPGWTSWKVMGEAESRKTMKNKKKKNNAKMRQKKKEWEEQQQRESEGTDEAGMDVEGAGADAGKDKNEAVADDNGDAKNDDDSSAEDEWEPVPPSWDEDLLQKRAESRGLFWYKSYEDVPSGQAHHIRQSSFPPSPEEVEKFQLEKCMRCLPHDLDTGGFFVALLKKVSPLSIRARRKADELATAVASKLDNTTSKWDKDDAAAKKKKLNGGEAAAAATDEVAEGTDEVEEKPEAADTEQPAKKQKNSYGFDNAESFVAATTDILAPIIDFYGFTDQFAQGQFFSRAGGNSKLLYFITESVKNQLIDRGVQDRIQVINSGLRAFERRSKDDNCIAR